MEELTVKAEKAEANWKSLWQAFKSVANFLRTPEGDGRSWAEFVTFIPARLHEFVKKGCHCALRSVLAHVQVLAPNAPLHKLIEEAESQEYLDAVERTELEVDTLVVQLVDQFNIHLPPPLGDGP